MRLPRCPPLKRIEGSGRGDNGKGRETKNFVDSRPSGHRTETEMCAFAACRAGLRPAPTQDLDHSRRHGRVVGLEVLPAFGSHPLRPGAVVPELGVFVDVGEDTWRAELFLDHLAAAQV